jgi:hypothetical protein
VRLRTLSRIDYTIWMVLDVPPESEELRMRVVTDAVVQARIEHEVACNGVRGFAEICGVSPAFISNIVNRKIKPSNTVLRVLGLEKVTIYREVK